MPYHTTFICKAICILFAQSVFAFGNPPFTKAQTSTLMSINKKPCIIVFPVHSKLPLNTLKKVAPHKQLNALFTLLDSCGFSQRDSATHIDTLRITTHAQSIIKSIRFMGSPLRFDSLFTFALPRPGNSGFINRIADSCVAVLTQTGYPFAHAIITVSKQTSDAGTLMPAAAESLHIVIRIDAGRACIYGQTPLLGFTKTNERILKHDVALVPGNPFNARDTIDTRQKLISRPYIESVVSEIPRVMASAPPSKDTVLVPFTITERTGAGITGALGIFGKRGEKTRLDGKLALSLLNLFGRGEQATLGYTSTASDLALSSVLIVPWIFNRPLSAQGAFSLEVRDKAYGNLEGSLTLLAELKSLFKTGVKLSLTETTLQTELAQRKNNFYGISFLLQRDQTVLHAGEQSYGVRFSTGSGLVSEEKNVTTRWHIDVASSLTIPFTSAFSWRWDIVSNALVSAEADIPAIALYRIGGFASVRGYSDNEFPFRSVLYARSEFHYFISQTGSVFLFTDPAIGFTKNISSVPIDRTVLFGLGAGISVPTKLGRLTLAWATHYSDLTSMGRIHIQLQSPFSIESSF